MGALLVYSYNLNRRMQPQSAQQIVSGVPAEEEDYLYILREKDGRLAVYFRGQSEPQMTFDVPVRTLPELDQRQLEEGIKVKDYQSLVNLIEDYIS